MSDKLREDFDIFYSELEGKTKSFKTSSQVIQTDSRLSKIGKSEKLAEIKAEHEKDLSDLGERLKKEFGTRVHNIANFVNGNAPDKRIEGIQGRLKKGDSLTIDQQNRLIIHELAENKTIMRKSNFQGMLVNADEKQLRKTSQALSDGRDTERLGWLKELADIKGDSVLSSSLEAQINHARDSTLSDEQKNLQDVSEKIQKGLELFQYSLERSKKGEFLDVRAEEILDGD